MASSRPSRPLNHGLVPLPPVEVLAVEDGGEASVGLLPDGLVGHAVEQDVDGVVEDVQDVHDAPQRQVGGEVEGRLLRDRPAKENRPCGL